MSIYTSTITLLLVMDPLGNIPIFLSVLNSVDPKRRSRIILRESFIAFILLTTFLFFGQSILDGFNITPSALGISGGIILFLIALKMIFPQHNDAQEKQIGEPFIVPLAIPLIAGPSALTTVLLLITQNPGGIFACFFALLLASFIITVILLFSSPLRRLLGQKGLTAIERLMGMILTTVAVQMFLTGIDNYFQLQHPN